jgi:hypothetical protein
VLVACSVFPCCYYGVVPYSFPMESRWASSSHLLCPLPLQIAEMKQVFRAYDSNNDGKLSFDEIVAASTVAEGGTNVWSASDLEAVLKKVCSPVVLQS